MTGGPGRLRVTLARGVGPGDVDQIMRAIEMLRGVSSVEVDPPPADAQVRDRVARRLVDLAREVRRMEAGGGVGEGVPAERESR